MLDSMGPFDGLWADSLIDDGSHQATGRIITGLLNILDGLRGDALLESPGTSETRDSLFDGVYISDPSDTSEVQRLLAELSYTAAQVKTLMETGNRQVLGRYFSEELLENRDFFLSVVSDLGEVIKLNDLIVSGLSSSNEVNAGWVYLAVKHFREALNNVEQSSHNPRSVIHEVIMDDLVDESATPIERNILRYGQHIGNLASYIFRAFFLEGKQNETVGTEFYDELLTYFPYLKEMLGFLEGINPANLDYLNVDDGKKEELVKSMKANLNSVKGCLGDVENPQNRDRLVNEVRGQSQIRQLMASMDVSFGLARKVMALLPSDATILGS